MPKGYFSAEIEITDPEIYRHYMPLAEAAVVAYGGRYIVRGGDMRVLEGNRPVRRAVILEFDSPQQAEAFYRSPQYQEALALRLQSSTGHAYLLTATTPRNSGRPSTLGTGSECEETEQCGSQLWRPAGLVGPSVAGSPRPGRRSSRSHAALTSRQSGNGVCGSKGHSATTR